MQMIMPTHTFVVEAACAASFGVAPAPLNVEHRIDDAEALAGRYTS